MDYIRQINAFENWNEYNEIGPGAQLLWYKLMRVANLSGWQNELSISNTKLQSMTRSTEKTLINNRNQLIQNGLLQYKKRGRTKAGIYILTDLTTGNTPVKSTVVSTVNPTVVSPVVSTVDTTAYINKTKLNKTKQDINIFLSGDQEEKVQSALEYVKEKWQTRQVPMQLIASISDWVQIWDKDLLLKAFEITANSKKVKVFGIKGYVNAILTDWESNGVKALSDLEKPAKKSEKLPWWSEMTNDDWAVYEKLSVDEQKKYQQERGG